MAIVHLEDLDLQAFIDAVTNIAKMQATEKLDGAQLWFGLDQNGKLYTSRSGKSKSAENVYSESDYPYYSSNNGFRSAHAALQSKEEEIKSVLRPGDTVEIEVLFGRQPNAVTYGAGGKNYIAFLRGVEGTEDLKIDQLANRLANQTAKVNVKLVETVDGEHLQLNDSEVLFQFVGVQKIDSAKLRDIDLQKQLSALKSFLEKKAALPGASVTNFELLTKSLGSFDKEIRPAAKELKAKTAAKVMTDYKLPIKKELLDKFVGQVKSPLAADDLSPEEDFGIEGVVLRHPETGEQIKLVDKDTFTTINQFNYAVRAGVSGLVRTTNSDAPLESRGGILGELKITIADLLGNREMARVQGAKKALEVVKGKTPEDTIRNLAKELMGGEDWRATQRKILALVKATKEKLAGQLKDFKANKDNFQLKLKSGKTMGFSAEIIRRTLLAFAEAKRDLDKLEEKIGKAKNFAQIVAVLYGKFAKVVHQTVEEAPVTEALLTEKRIFTDKSQYQGKDAWTLLNIYFATVMMAVVIYKANDKLGIRFLKDKTHCRLTSWNKEMSALNFWGYVIWRVATPQVKKLIGKKNAADLWRHVRKAPPNWWRFLHMDLSFGRDVPIDWDDHRKTLRLLQHFPAMNIDRVNILLDGVFKYEQLTLDEKVKLLPKLHFFAQMFVPLSPLLTRIRAIQQNELVNANGENYQMVSEMKLLKSVVGLAEEDAAPAGGDAATASTATTSGAVASLPMALNGKNVVRMKRRKWQSPKFPNPNKAKSNEATQ